MPVDALLGGFAQVVPKVPPIGDLQGLWGAAGGAVGEERGPVAADDLDAGALGEPGREGVGLPVGQEIDRTTCLDVDVHGSVVLSLALGVFIHPEHAGRGRGRIRKRGDQPQQGVAADWRPKESVMRAPARPASARPTETSVDRSRSVRRPNRRVSSGTCSTNVLRGQKLAAQTNRRTRSATMTDLPAVGRP